MRDAEVGGAVGERVGPHEGDALGGAEAHAEVGEVRLALALRERVKVDEDGARAELPVVVEFKILAGLVAQHGEALDVAGRVARDKSHAPHNEVHHRIVCVQDTGE